MPESDSIKENFHLTMFDNNFPAIPGYQIEKQLKIDTINGISIYKARSTARQQTVVLKVFSFNTVSHWNGSLELNHEAEILKSLSHEKIPCFVRTFFHEQHEVFIYEYCSGRRLVDYTKQLPKQKIQRILKQLLNILIYLQDQPQPIIHSKIRPENILYIEATDEIFLTDFRQAHFLTNSDSEKATLIQEYSVFQPPISSKVNLSDDLYSVGILIIQLLTQLKTDELANLPKDLGKLKAIPQNWVVWLNKLIDKNPKKRYQTAQLALEAFNEANSAPVAEPIAEKVKSKKTPLTPKTKNQKPDRSSTLDQFLKEIVNSHQNAQQTQTFGKKQAQRNVEIYRKTVFKNKGKPDFRRIVALSLSVLPIMITTNPRQEAYLEYASGQFLERSPQIQNTFTKNALKSTIKITTQQQSFGIFSIYQTSSKEIGEMRTIGAFGNFISYSEIIDHIKSPKKK